MVTSKVKCSGCNKILVVLSLISIVGRATAETTSGSLQRFDIHTITCDPSWEGCQSKSLETIAAEVKEQTDVQIDIKTPQLRLNGTVNFANIISFTINGEPGLTNITCTAGDGDDAGIVLSDILEKVTLNNLNLKFCGSRIKNTYDKNKTYSSALFMIRCRNVELNGLVIEKSRGTGLTVLNHQGGEVNVKSAIFTENKLPQEYITESVQGGGGVYILLGRLQQGSYSPLTFQFENCTFKNNTSRTKYYSFLYTDVMGEVREGYGRGGGVHLSLLSGLKNTLISFVGCNFTTNQAFVGGGISAKTFGGNVGQETSNVTVEIGNSLFENNGCNHPKHSYFGGGAHLSFNTLLDGYGSFITDSHYRIRSVTFIKNCAELGGGVFYFSDRSQQGSGDNSDNTMSFDDCMFKTNEARIGSAVDMTPNIFMKLSTGYTIVPTFTNCQFLGNFVNINHSQSQHEIQMTAGVGTIYACLHNIQFQGYNRFENNWGSAVYIVNGIVNFQNSSVSFINNTGLQGGAVALIGSSTMIVGPNNYDFIGNKAIYYGGAVYVLLIDSTDFTTSSSCFIQYSDDDSAILSVKWNANITFIGNKARDDTSGHAIYATSLHPCQVVNNGTKNRPKYHLVNISDVFTIRDITFNDDEALHPQIATDGATLQRSKPTPLMIIPGGKYEHGVTITDDLGQLVDTSFRATVGRNAKSVKLNTAFSSFVGNKIQLTGKPKQNASLYLQTVSPRQSFIRLEVKLSDCPPGFMLSDKLECVCNVDAYVGLFKCDFDNFHSHLLPGYWAGLIETLNGSELATSTCPFCDYSYSISNTSEFEVVLPQSYSELNKRVCGETRTGIVCGKCQDNYTVHFHSPGFQCKPAEPAGCKLGWLFYILSELVPVTMVFITVLVLNISFTSGTINGFILFSQLLDSQDLFASGVITFPDSVKHKIENWTKGYQVIYGFFNLDFFNSEPLSFCLWKAASALDMIAIKYVTIIYTLTLIVAVIWIFNRCGGRCCGKYCRITTVRMSVIHGISTFLVISYAQCIKVSLDILIPVHFHVEENSKFRPHTRVWLNGELKYFSKEHLPYALLALFCLCTIGLFPPALLLTYPFLNKVMAFLSCEDSKAVNIVSQKLPMSRLKPLLDSIQGCFKDNSRFFAGLYFLYRWLIFLINMNTRSYGVYFTAVGGILVFILTLHTICQPYIKRAHNVVDTLLFADLVLINSLSFLNYHRSRGQRGVHQGVTISPAVVQLVLIYLPLVVMGVHLLCKCATECGSKSLLSSTTTHFIPEPAMKLREVIRTIGAPNKVTDSIEEELTHDQLMDEDVEYLGVNSD